MVERIGMIAGSGQFPLLFAKAAISRDMEVYAVGYHGETDPAIREHVATLEWLYVGQVKRIINFFRQYEIHRAVMLGGIGKVRLLANFRPDTKAIGLLARIRNTHDDAVLRGFADLLQEEGIQIEPSTMLLPELLSPPGVWTSRRPSRDERDDISLGWKIAKEIGRLDVGQCVVTAGGSVVAVEAIEGTDAAITRGGQLADGQAVVVKVCKPTQDTRFDIPAIGLKTIETMHTANVRALAVEAGKSVVFDREAMITKADEYKITIVGLKDGELS